LDAHIGGDLSAELRRKCQEFFTLKSPTRKAQWFKSLMDTLDSEVDESIRKRVIDLNNSCATKTPRHKVLVKLD